MADSIEQLGFELISGALSEQERMLSGLRACAAISSTGLVVRSR
jgi:hypothetical protein